MRRLTLLFLLLNAFTLRAQSVQVAAFNSADSVVLRWAPSSVQAWERFNRYGCRIERVDVSTNERAAIPLGTDTLKPMSLELLRQRMNDNPYAPVVAQALYGAEIRPGNGDLRGQMDAADQSKLRWSLCALYADIDLSVANALGYRWVDRSLSASAHYLYRVISLDPEHADTALVAVDRSRGSDAVPAGPMISASEQERRIDIHWEAETARLNFSAYWIERAQGSGAWQRLNSTPFVPMDSDRGKLQRFTWKDTTITADYTPYRYRVLGITAFGMTSSENTVITAMGRDRTAPPSPEMRGVKEANGKLVVHWEQPAGAPDLKGFRVEKTYHANAAYVPLHRDPLPPNTRQFTDTSRYLIEENHYRVVAIDTAGNESVSLSGYGALADSIAPAAPIDLQGHIDTTGWVTVLWPLGKEADILGYRVFFANAADHNFNNLSPEPIQDTVFRDSIPLRTLTKDIFYRVVAVDRSFNHSPMSATLHLRKPDVVAPVAPVFERYAVTDSAVVLHFVPSSSSDVARHQLLRRSDTDTTWRELINWSVQETARAWTDHTVQAAHAYTYALFAVDSAGNRSARSVPLEVRLPMRTQREAASQVIATALDEVVQVQWQAPRGNVKHYVIYRSRDGAPAHTVGSAGSDTNRFVDIRLPGKGRYTYAVKAVYTDGGASRVTEATSPVVVP
ncbi:MAG: hypothetical protein R2811_07325 [Flavobacteriales bacterium]